jgi:peptide methionine sulfoxide reductase msrA/msrB
MSKSMRFMASVRSAAAAMAAFGLTACPEKTPGASTKHASPEAVPGAEVDGTPARGEAVAAGSHLESAGDGEAAAARALAPATPGRGPLPPEQWRKLDPEAERVIVHRGTERPFTGKYVAHKADGTYHCRRCDAPLFASSAKFDSGTGWPSFDAALPGAVRKVPDPDGTRTEIVCSNCGAHLGHVFEGEGFTEKNVRHCVNSVSLSFEPSASQVAADQGPRAAYFAGGCFWGVEHYFEQLPGVISAESGYMGGRTKAPSYEDVSRKRTGHAETVKVTYDPGRVPYEELARLFFEIHDPTQQGRQGPDVGSQYRSAVFVTSAQERRIVERLIGELKARGYAVVTEVASAGTFWKAEEYHQDYYAKTGGSPYCHVRVRRFDGQP